MKTKLNICLMVIKNRKYFLIVTSMLFIFFVTNCAHNTNVTANAVIIKMNVLDDQGSKDKRYELTFFRKGKIVAERVYERGKTIRSSGEIPDGPVLELYSSGQIRNILTFRDGKRNGPAIGFYESGKLRTEGTNRDGNPNGIGIVYYENGRVKAEWKIENRRELYHKEYDEEGRLVYEQQGGAIQVLE